MKRLEKWMAGLSLATSGGPTNPAHVVLSSKAPKGLKLVYTAESSVQADLLRQLLRDAEFGVEYVPSAATGMFGSLGEVDIYLPEAEAAEGREFLLEYMRMLEEGAEPPEDDEPPREE